MLALLAIATINPQSTGQVVALLPLALIGVAFSARWLVR